MRRLIVSEFITLDGVIEAPETWQFPFMAPDVMETIVSGILGVETGLYGRVTYDIFADAWPKETEDKLGFETHLNSSPKFVVSTTLKEAAWANTTIIRHDPMAEVAKLKSAPGGAIGVTGSGRLVTSLLRAGLVDELRLLVHPVVIGRGQRLFPDGADTAQLKLVESRAYSTGVVGLTYNVEKQ